LYEVQRCYFVLHLSACTNLTLIYVQYQAEEALAATSMWQLKALAAAAAVPQIVKTIGVAYRAQTKVGSLLILIAVITAVAAVWRWWSSPRRPNYTTVVFAGHAALQLLSAFSVGEAIVHTAHSVSAFHILMALKGLVSILFRHKLSWPAQRLFIASYKHRGVDASASAAAVSAAAASGAPPPLLSPPLAKGAHDAVKNVELWLLRAAAVVGVYTLVMSGSSGGGGGGGGFLSLFTSQRLHFNALLTAVSATALHELVERLSMPSTLLRLLRTQHQVCCLLLFFLFFVSFFRSFVSHLFTHMLASPPLFFSRLSFHFIFAS
jgi:hypothetical protein